MRTNVVNVFKKSDKQTLKNYQQISLQPIERIIFEKLLSSTQSGFTPRDSCIYYQLISKMKTNPNKIILEML